MDYEKYFNETAGTGILSTSDSQGRVDAALYSRPHYLNGNLVFIMRDRLSHDNLQSNPHAVYLFMEEGPGRKGKRLYLTRTKEEKNSEMITSLKRRQESYDSDEDRYLVFFEVNKERPLVGDTP